jgi:hypothetical protein
MGINEPVIKTKIFNYKQYILLVENGNNVHGVTFERE